jgi:hypothetical protein
MEPNAMITVGLVPSQQLVSLLTDDEGNWRDVPEGQTVVPLVKIPKPEQGAWEPNVVWFEDRVERQWVAGTPAPAPTFTAEQHLESVGLGGNRQPTLLYLRQAGAQSPKLNAIEAYLNQILAMFAANPAPRSDWPNAPYTFEETVGEAVASLTPNPES